MDLIETMRQALESRCYRIDELTAVSEAFFRVQGQNRASHQEVSLFLQLFDTEAKMQITRFAVKTETKVAPGVVKFYQSNCFQLGPSHWALLIEFEVILRSLSEEIAHRRRTNEPWTAQELFSVLTYLLDGLAAGQMRGEFLSDLSPMVLYCTREGVKLPSRGWVRRKESGQEGDPYKKSMLELGQTLVQMAALLESLPSAGDSQRIAESLPQPKWLRCFLRRMLSPNEHLRPDFHSLTDIIRKSTSSAPSNCPHLDSQAENVDGCSVCGQFFCRKCDYSETPLCRACQATGGEKPQAASAGETPGDTDVCDECKGVFSREDVISVSDGVVGKFCRKCLQGKLDEHEKATSCRRSLLSFLYNSMLQSL